MSSPPRIFASPGSARLRLHASVLPVLAWMLVALSGLTYGLHRPPVAASFGYHCERVSRVLCVSLVLAAPASVLRSILR